MRTEAAKQAPSTRCTRRHGIDFIVTHTHRRADMAIVLSPREIKATEAAVGLVIPA